MKYLKHLAAICAILFTSYSLYCAARGSGSYTSGKVGLYKPISREDPGWATDSTSSYNANFDIIASTLNSIIIGTLSDFTSNYIQLRNTLQSGATFYVTSGTLNNLNVGGAFTVNTTTASINTLISSSQTITSQLTVSSSVITTLRASSATITTLFGPTGSIPASLLQSGSTNYIRLTDTLQAGATFFVSSGQVSTALLTNSLSVVGSGSSDQDFSISKPGGTAYRIGTAGTALPIEFHNPNLTNRATLGANGAWTFLSSMTVTNNFLTTGSTSLGDDSGDNVQTNTASFTFVNVTTISTPSGSHFSNVITGPPCASGFLRIGPSICIDADSNLELMIASTTATSDSTLFRTVDSATLNGTNARAVILQVRAFIEQDGVADDTQLRFCIRKTGDTTACGLTNIVVNLSANLANEDSAQAGYAIVAVDGNRDFDISCALVAGALNGSTQDCRAYLAGYLE